MEPRRTLAQTHLVTSLRRGARPGSPYRPPSVRRVLSVLLVAVVLALIASPSVADGPGYGGTADRLTVTWTEDRVTAAGAGGAATRGGPVLRVTGLGFRGGSSVAVQVGDQGTSYTRVDQVGELRVWVRTGPEASVPGTSVLAVGRASSGTTRTLIGSVPPPPQGTSPTSRVLAVAVAGCVLAGVARALRAVRSRRVRSGGVEAVPDAAHRADVPLLRG